MPLRGGAATWGWGQCVVWVWCDFGSDRSGLLTSPRVCSGTLHNLFYPQFFQTLEMGRIIPYRYIVKIWSGKMGTTQHSVGPSWRLSKCLVFPLSLSTSHVNITEWLHFPCRSSPQREYLSNYDFLVWQSARLVKMWILQCESRGSNWHTAELLFSFYSIRG